MVSYLIFMAQARDDKSPMDDPVESVAIVTLRHGPLSVRKQIQHKNAMARRTATSSLCFCVVNLRAD
jgi:hypothetical protein